MHRTDAFGFVYQTHPGVWKYVVDTGSRLFRGQPAYASQSEAFKAAYRVVSAIRFGEDPRAVTDGVTPPRRYWVDLPAPKTWEGDYA